MAWCNNPEKPRTLYPSRHKSPSSPSDLKGNLMARHYTVNLVYAQRKRALSRTHPEKWTCEWAGKHTFMRLKVKWQNYVLVFKIILRGPGWWFRGWRWFAGCRDWWPKFDPQPLTPRTHMVEEYSWLLGIVLWLLHMWVPPPCPPQKINRLRWTWELFLFYDSTHWDQCTSFFFS